MQASSLFSGPPKLVNECCRVTVCSTNPEELDYKSNELNTINL